MSFEFSSLDVDLVKERVHALVRTDPCQTFRKQLLAVLKAPNEHGNFSVVVSSKALLNADVVLGHLVLRSPEKALLLLGSALVDEQEHLVREASAGGANKGWTVKRNTHARVNWLPSAHCKPNISSIRSHDVGSLIQFTGTVVRSGQLKVLEALRVFKCGNSKCQVPIRCVAATNEVGSIIQFPSGPCPHCKKSASYTELVHEKVCWDYQEVRVQESVQKLEMGSIPRSITVVCLHDLVDTCKAGDDVVVTGYPFNRWGTLYKDERCQLEVVIMANSIHVGGSGTAAATTSASAAVAAAAVAGARGPDGGGAGTTDNLAFLDEFQRFWAEHADQPLRGRDVLVRSVCPQLHGLYYVKLAVLLCLCGSSPSIDPNNGARTRGDPHLLLVGDPGTGKSQFLRFACKLMSRSVLTTGCGTTSAGLTCATVREGSEFMLEAGALVLADRGVCCIDEFGSIREHDRATIHEAMEQQSLSIAKAGLVTQLNTRATIIAATNPKGQFDVDADISSNTGIAPPLLSRFDLVMVLLDRADHSWDRTVSEFVLKSQLDAKAMKLMVESPAAGGGVATSPPPPPAAAVLSLDKLRMYLTHVKKTFEPSLTPQAADVLSKYYISQRRVEHDGSGRTTLRFLESLIRISKAHARLMARNVVLLGDALVTIALVELSTSAGLGSQGETLHVDFPAHPDDFFRENVARDLLTRMGLPQGTDCGFRVGSGSGPGPGSGSGGGAGGAAAGAGMVWSADMQPGGFAHAFFPSSGSSGSGGNENGRPPTTLGW